MKNVYLIPTDKPSKLFKDDFGKLFYSINIDQEQKHFEPQNIYITSSDEQIKEGDWIIDLVKNIISKANGFSNEDNDIVLDNGSFATIDQCIKIILTDNPDLIKDGVQPIDDKFIEWFVKNPSCEEVKIESWQTKGEWDLDYKIIIPNSIEEYELWGLEKYLYELEAEKAEPKLVNNCAKCGMDLVIRETSVPVCTDIDCRGIILSNETLRECALQKERQKQHLIDIMKGDEELGLYEEQPKQDYSGVHLRHCYQGEYEDGCKYGENDCPAKPKEEPKDVVLGYKTSVDAQMLDRIEPKQESLTYTEAAKKEERIFNSSMSKQEPTMITDWLDEYGDPEIYKKVERELELREAAERIFNIPEEKNGDVYFGSKIAHLRKGFKFGAKWMQERMYSETEVLQLLLKLQQTESYDNLYDWFEQFKKK